MPVIVKELAIHRLESWKQEELFRREIAVLKQLYGQTVVQNERSRMVVASHFDTLRVLSRFNESQENDSVIIKDSSSLVIKNISAQWIGGDE